MIMSMEDKVEILAIDVPVVTPNTSCEEVYHLFQEDQDLLAVTVLEDGQPIGLAHRTDLTLALADRFGYSLYARKPISTLITEAPLIVDASNSIDFLSNMLAYDATHALQKGFIICRGSEYVGVGTAISLLQASIERTRRRAEELQKAKTIAIQANKSKSAFLANMNHELRTPLNAIIGFTEMIQKEAYGPIPQKEYREYVDIVNSSGNHLLNVINAILDMSKIEAGKMEMREQECDIFDLVGQISRMMTSAAGKKNITLDLDLPDDLPDLCCDPTMIRQVLLNLISNAIKFSPEDTTVSLTTRMTDCGNLCISVRDQGVGISKENIKAVLKPFFQVDGDLNRSQEGTGLGLSIVKAYLELHQARLDIESELGQGTNITVTFPSGRVVCTEEACCGLEAAALAE
ncbi:ATP-binding protein [Emcibacter sp.]|uniref:ATP-binding protein n=1 Tax=Emcibacter sp. TaxID=1979954 RepID=UPI002AA95D29|nr:ATP-binding protein [Emcibacter sp.]